MNQKQSWESDFDKLYKSDIEDGTAVPHEIKAFFQDTIQQAIQTREREISEEVDKEFGTLTDFFGNDAKPRLKALINHQ